MYVCMYVLRIGIHCFLNMPFIIIIVLYSSQVYYELDDQRTKVDAKDVAICRVEQLCPFPYDLVQRELKRYPSMSFQNVLLKWILIFFL